MFEGLDLTTFGGYLVAFVFVGASLFVSPPFSRRLRHAAIAAEFFAWLAQCIRLQNRLEYGVAALVAAHLASILWMDGVRISGGVLALALVGTGSVQLQAAWGPAGLSNFGLDGVGYIAVGFWILAALYAWLPDMGSAQALARFRLALTWLALFAVAIVGGPGLWRHLQFVMLGVSKAPQADRWMFFPSGVILPYGGGLLGLALVFWLFSALTGLRSPRERLSWGAAAVGTAFLVSFLALLSWANWNVPGLKVFSEPLRVGALVFVALVLLGMLAMERLVAERPLSQALSMPEADARSAQCIAWGFPWAFLSLAWQVLETAETQGRYWAGSAVEIYRLQLVCLYYLCFVWPRLRRVWLALGLATLIQVLR